jgi:hypothetical protein
MDFRLVYRGALEAETNRPRTARKQAMRRCFHEQLKELWLQHPFLRAMAPVDLDLQTNEQIYRFDRLALDHSVQNKNGDTYCFLPLIGGHYGISCSLDVLFLRRESAGGLVKYGGDLDNRIKVLFDALRMPRDAS